MQKESLNSLSLIERNCEDLKENETLFKEIKIDKFLFFHFIHSQNFVHAYFTYKLDSPKEFRKKYECPPAMSNDFFH